MHDNYLNTYRSETNNQLGLYGQQPKALNCQNGFTYGFNSYIVEVGVFTCNCTLILQLLNPILN